MGTGAHRAGHSVVYAVISAVRPLLLIPPDSGLDGSCGRDAVNRDLTERCTSNLPYRREYHSRDNRHVIHDTIEGLSLVDEAAYRNRRHRVCTPITTVWFGGGSITPAVSRHR